MDWIWQVRHSFVRPSSGQEEGIIWNADTHQVVVAATAASLIDDVRIKMLTWAPEAYCTVIPSVTSG